VINLWKSDDDVPQPIKSDASKRKNQEARKHSSLRSVGAGVLAQVQTVTLGHILVHVGDSSGVRSLPVRTYRGRNCRSTCHSYETSNVECKGRDQPASSECVGGFSCSGEVLLCSIVMQGAAMYLGCMLSHLQTCLFDDERTPNSTFLCLFELVQDSSLSKAGDTSTPDSDGMDERIRRIARIVADAAVQVIQGSPISARSTPAALPGYSSTEAKSASVVSRIRRRIFFR
jgi:hypothetical protein